MTTVTSDIDSLSLYFKEISRVPLLTYEQEVTYGRAVQKLVKLETIKVQLLETINREPTLAEWAEVAYMSIEELEAALKAGQQAKQKMVTANLRLVVSIAKKYTHQNVDLMDLIQEGTIGLQRGVEKFDPSMGYRFSTYSYWWIRQAIARKGPEASRVVKLPVHIHEKISKIKKAQRQLAQTHGRPATYSEIAEAVNICPDKVKDYVAYARRPFSLNACIGKDQNTELGELIEDDAPSPEDFLTQDLLLSDLHKTIQQLTPEQQEVLSLRFGLNDGKEISFAKIGERLNISHHQARTIEKKALRYLRQQHSSLQDYFATM